MTMIKSKRFDVYLKRMKSYFNIFYFLYKFEVMLIKDGFKLRIM